jgi:imidazolonepropionase-like amidohydrolase
MMAGSDFGGGFVVAGFGLHHEFDLLAQAGLSPLDVLQMTTLNGAKFLGREATMGSVAEGKNADLVLLDANPIASVANLHRISAVVRAGTYYPAGALAAMKEQTATRVAAGLASAPNAPPLCACCMA